MLHPLQYDTTNEIINFSKPYFKTKPKDCILYSKDNAEFIEIHKELLGQTEFMREILKSVNDHCCGKIEIICPCTKDELEKIVLFLYIGEIQCEDEIESLDVQDALSKIFGFPESLNLDNPFEDQSFPSTIDLVEFDLNEEIIENIVERDEMNAYVNMDLNNNPTKIDPEKSPIGIKTYM